MNVAGIDYSTRAVDIVVIPHEGDGPPQWRRLPLIGNDAFDRTRNVADLMPGRHAAFWDDIMAVGIEHPGGKFGTGDMLRVQGAILSCLPSRMLVEPWPPAKWRKAVGLPGNASKKLAAQKSILCRAESAEYPATFGGGLKLAAEFIDWPQDAHDAHLIALATRHAITKAAA